MTVEAEAPLSTLTAPELLIYAPPCKFKMVDVMIIIPVLLFVIGTGLPAVTVAEVTLMVPELLTVVPPLKVILDDVAVILAPLLLVMVTGFPLVRGDVVFRLTLPELVNVLPPDKPNVAVLKVTLFAPVALFVNEPPLLTVNEAPELKVMLLDAPTMSEPLMLDEPPNVAALVPAVVKVFPLFTVNAPLTVKLADSVMVVVPVMVIEAHDDATFTVGLLKNGAVAGIMTASPAPGIENRAVQLRLLFQLLLVRPVQV